ncbi:hypothetical protein CQ017_02790 [Arthrobacter sp. MYb224]|uniref:hypothetical protein n=1 Tax=unclassified Arthrobacter TaxID=235627 RepID=UPI000CFABBBD|nr:MULTISPECIES: hypothetical protein [unclassified Arthrobacter]PRA01430.1 hypothetical protein CQ017_02790 [Arthrobacter sp. MYb224]PRA06378.1 hypothetical protein CQ019_02990 [Arthrobacter sp. MYb229]PRB53280.1 hypothetical protein CQ013_02990 [Arthrobacter sp. MYb216]
MSCEPGPLEAHLGSREVRPAHLRLESLSELPVKGRVEHLGYIQSVSYSAPNTPPRLTAVVVDRLAGVGGRRGTVPHVKLLFMGQKQVPGIKPGVKIRYAGMVAQVDHVPSIFNPRYLIVPVNRR